MMPPRNKKDNIFFYTLRCANSLLAYRSFRIANNLLAICSQLTIKKIHLLHILQVLPGKALGFRYGSLQILTEISIESTTVNIFGITNHDVTTEGPIEAQHLSVYLRGSLDLATTVTFF